MSGVSLAGAPDTMSGALVYPFKSRGRPELGEVMEVAPGVLWVRMKLPFQLAHINLWLIEDGPEGYALVDTGIRDQTTRDAWDAIFSGPLAGRHLTRVIVTHLHPDHVGMAGSLVRRFGCPFHMSRTDYLLCRVLVEDTGKQAPDEGVRFYRAAGFDDAAIERYTKRFGGFGLGVSRMPQAYQRMQDGGTLSIGGRDWHFVTGRGHAPEHICLWCPELNVFISGDQILPRISSNVSVFPTEPDADPLSDWLESCARLRDLLPEDILVLPAHNEPFVGAGKRLQTLIDEHEDGLAKLHDLCAAPKRAIDVFPALFRSRITEGNLLMATGESIAHLNCLIGRGAIRASGDANGVRWYEAA